jgi:hypothetical protein
MPGKRDGDKVNLGWWAPSAFAARIRTAAARRGITVTDALDEAARNWLAENETTGETDA